MNTAARNGLRVSCEPTLAGRNCGNPLNATKIGSVQIWTVTAASLHRSLRLSRPSISHFPSWLIHLAVFLLQVNRNITPSLKAQDQ